MLPQQFLDRMKGMMGNEYDSFLETYGQEPYQALRLNALKKRSEGRNAAELSGSAETLGHRDTAKVPWAEDCYYYEPSAQPGKHPYHQAGVYYIQEPSAMAPAQLLEVQPGERVLDLCAAPGGKSTQIAAKLRGEGFLLCNEINASRAKILSENVERMGIVNAYVTNETPERLAEVFPEYFDKILVDAPCSGEGMFRKNELACEEWSPENVDMCAKRQDGILDCAARMLRPGGRLVYSTCTFAPAENEGSVSRFLGRWPEFMTVPIAKEVFGTEHCNGSREYLEKSMHSGEPCPELVGLQSEGLTTHDMTGDMSCLEHTLRLWPHLIRGEGHYIARLCRRGDAADGQKQRDAAEKQAVSGNMRWQITGEKKLCKLMEEFLADELGIGGTWMARHPGRVVRFGEQIYLLPEEMISLTGIKVLRPGLQLAVEKKNRLEPAHALARSLLTTDFPVGSGHMRGLTEREAVSYLRGESIACGEEKGWMALSYEGYMLGFGKASGGQVKNHYPKGLRKSL